MAFIASMAFFIFFILKLCVFKGSALCKKVTFETRMSNTVWKLFFLRVKFYLFWPSFGLQFYTSLHLASLGTAWYKISGLFLAKKMNFTLRKKIFIPFWTWCVEKRHFYEVDNAVLMRHKLCSPLVKTHYFTENKYN